MKRFLLPCWKFCRTLTTRLCFALENSKFILQNEDLLKITEIPKQVDSGNNEKKATNAINPHRTYQSYTEYIVDTEGESCEWHPSWCLVDSSFPETRLNGRWGQGDFTFKRNLMTGLETINRKEPTDLEWWWYALHSDRPSTRLCPKWSFAHVHRDGEGIS